MVAHSLLALPRAALLLGAAAASSLLDTSKLLDAFPPAFIRENLRSSWERNSVQRVDNRLAANLTLVSAEPLDAEGQEWRVEFSDGTQGDFILPPMERENDIAEMPRALWGSEGSRAREVERALLADGGVLRFSYSAVMGNVSGHGAARGEQLEASQLPKEVAEARMRFFEALHSHGIVVLEGAPAEAGMATALVEGLVGAVEGTLFGYSFQVKKVGLAHNLAYDNIALQHHHDLPYMQKPPDVEVFGCVRSAKEGGASLWADAFALAETLRREDPEAFEILSSTPVQFVDLTDKWDMRATHPTIELDSQRQVKRVYFNERTRDSWRQWRPSQPRDAAERFYKALRAFEAMVDNQEWHVSTPLQPGEVAIFDNGRVMHSRTAFEGERYMEGTYMLWESAHASWRSLRQQLREEPYHYCGVKVGL